GAKPMKTTSPATNAMMVKKARSRATGMVADMKPPAVVAGSLPSGFGANVLPRAAESHRRAAGDAAIVLARQGGNHGGGEGCASLTSGASRRPCWHAWTSAR